MSVSNLSLQIPQAESPNFEEIESGDKTPPIHFPWLTETRFFAAFAVLVHHLSQAKWLAGIGGEPHGWIAHLGNHGVRVFFVLSGLLITHLLLAERKKTGTVDVKKFYVRRALRIWPLYYALLAVIIVLPVSWLVLKEPSYLATLAAAKWQNAGVKFGLLACLLPNLAVVAFPSIIGFGQAWSIGVEEQFYLVWPILMKKLGDRPLLALSAVLVAKIAVAIAITYIVLNPDIQMPSALRYQLSVAFNFVNIFQIEAMVIGGAAAYLLMKKRDAVVRVTRNPIFRSLLVGALLVCFSEAWSQLHEQIACDIAYAALLLTLTLSGKDVPVFAAKPLAYFGKISYGIYMLHPLVICLVIKLLYAAKIPVSNGLFVVALYALVIPLSLTVSAASFELLERRFLTFKDKFMVVKSSAT